MLQLTNTSPIYPFKEILAYEALWANKETSFKTLASLFSKHPNSRPSDFIEGKKFLYITDDIKKCVLNNEKRYKTNVLINGTFDFPAQLKDAKEPVELLYYTGRLEYLKTRRVAIVGTRKPSKAGMDAAKMITEKLVADDFTIVSGLAEGIDTVTHTTTINSKGRTIAVLGTPLNSVYPRENEGLQNIIAKEHLLISQVPFYRYSKQDYRLNRLFFLERNKTMSALTEATLIVEAADTSGSLTQARAAIDQNRKLLIWEDCFNNKSITWPEKYLAKGALRVKNYEEISRHLNDKDV